MQMSPKFFGKLATQMAVFLDNCCKFRGCGLSFNSLSDLIQHIEEAHIDTDPHVLAKQELQQPQTVALSYVLRVFTDVAHKESPKPRPSSVSPAPSLGSNTTTGSELDEDDVHSEDNDSDSSWTTREELTSELILSMISKPSSENDKPYACPVPGCKKRYKNINGIKYHAKNGHKKEIRVKKQFPCKCGKSYKTAQGLQQHALLFHARGEIVNSRILKTKPSPVLLSNAPTASQSVSTSTLNNMTPVTLNNFVNNNNIQKLAGLGNLSVTQLTQLTQVIPPPNVVTPNAFTCRVNPLNSVNSINLNLPPSKLILAAPLQAAPNLNTAVSDIGDIVQADAPCATSSLNSLTSLDSLAISAEEEVGDVMEGSDCIPTTEADSMMTSSDLAVTSSENVEMSPGSTVISVEG